MSPPSEPEVRAPVEERITGTPDRLDGIRQRLEWLDGRVPAPHLVRTESSVETGVDAVLVVERLAGEPATAVQHRVDATRAIASFANALAAVHALDAATCPFEIDVASMVEEVVRRAAAGELSVDDATYAHVTPARLADLLAAGADQFAAPVRPVVCNGHPTLGSCVIDGGTVGFERVDDLGVADVSFDLAIAARSVAREFAPSFVGPFFAAYDEASDTGPIDLARLDWFQLLDALR